MTALKIRQPLQGVIDRRAESLVAKIVSGEASPSEVAEFKELALQRSSMMIRPRIAEKPFRPRIKHAF